MFLFFSIDTVDGLLAAVTDLLTHVLTIGKAIISFGLQPNIRPLVIHILNGFNKIDLGSNDQSASNLPVRFHELLNMFPDNKVSEVKIENIRTLVFILTQSLNDYIIIKKQKDMHNDYVDYTMSTVAIIYDERMRIGGETIQKDHFNCEKTMS